MSEISQSKYIKKECLSKATSAQRRSGCRQTFGIGGVSTEFRRPQMELFHYPFVVSTNYENRFVAVPYIHSHHGSLFPFHSMFIERRWSGVFSHINMIAGSQTIINIGTVTNERNILFP